MENTDSEVINILVKTLETQSGPLVVVPHSNPDGDAIGSAFALAIVLKNSGKDVKIVTPNDYPAFLNWMNDGEIEVLNYLKNKREAENYLHRCSIMFCVDFNEPGRVDEMEEKVNMFQGMKILIDHHPNPVDFCSIAISEPSYSSTAELVFEVVRAAGYEKYLTKRAAEALYAGIMTDTGSFSYSISRPELYRVLAALMTYHIDTEVIHSRVYDNFSTERFRLMGYCLLNKMVIIPEFRSAYISITRDELKMFNFVPGDTESFVNIPLSINNIVFSALFIEKENLTKASFRSKGSFPSNSFSSAHFNGGGHRNAAGGESKLPLVETLELFRQLLPAYSDQLENADKNS